MENNFYMPSIREIRNQAYVDSPCDLASDGDDFFRRGVNYILENDKVAHVIENYSNLLEALRIASKYVDGEDRQIINKVIAQSERVSK